MRHGAATWEWREATFEPLCDSPVGDKQASAIFWAISARTDRPSDRDPSPMVGGSFASPKMTAHDPRCLAAVTAFSNPAVSPDTGYS